MTIRILLTAAIASAMPFAASGQDRDFDRGLDDDRRFDWTLRAMASYLNTDDLGDAWGGMIGAGFQPVDWFSTDLRVGYLRADDESLDIIPIEGVAMFRAFNVDVVEPYAGIGVGHYFMDADDFNTSDTQAIFPLVGMDLRLPETKLRIFGEVRYMFFEDSISDDVDANMDGIGANLGVTWTF